MVKSSLLFVFVCVLASSYTLLHGQKMELNFDHLTINDGLSQNSVFSIIQDAKGFIWVGTEDGLNKYDGYRFVKYKPSGAKKGSLSRIKIYALLEDDQRLIWIGTADGLEILDSRSDQFLDLNSFKNAEILATAYVTDLFRDRSGDIWVASFEGLSHYSQVNNSFEHYFRNLEMPEEERKVWSVFQDSDGIIWLGLNRDLVRFDPTTKKRLTLPKGLDDQAELRNGTIQVIQQDHAGNFWFGTETKGLFHYIVEQDTCLNYRYSSISNSIASDMVRDIHIYKENEIWIGTRDGLSIFNKDVSEFTNISYHKYDDTGLSHNSIRVITEDRAGSIWLGTYAGGVNVYHPSDNNFNHVKEKMGDNAGLSLPVVSSIIPTEEGLWIGTEGGGLNFINRTEDSSAFFTKESTNDAFPSDNIKSLAMDRLGNLWIGTYDGLSYYDSAKGEFSDVYSENTNDVLSNYKIYSLSIKRDVLWIGTNGGGLYKRTNDGNLINFVHQPGNSGSISGNNVTSILEEEHSLWLGTESGLNKMNKENHEISRYLHEYGENESLSNNAVLSLFIDSKGRLWVGTDGGGVNVYDELNNIFYAITETHGLSSNVIHAIQEDDKGHVWVSTNKGISEIMVDENSPFDAEKMQVQTYTSSDGLQSNQFLNGAVAKGQKGELLFAGIAGITTFFPEKIVHNQLVPEVVLTDLLINNVEIVPGVENSPLLKPLMETESITLKHDQSFFTFRFVALNYVNSAKNNYAYRLDGLSGNDQWNYIGTQSSVNFTNVKPGKYVFKVKASNNDGLWNKIPAQVDITVLPPIWKTWWAYLTYALIFSFLLILFYFFSKRNARLKSELLFEQLSHDKDIELNQRKLKFFTNISHEIKTPLTLILAPLNELVRTNEGNNKILNQLMLMQRNGERLIHLINQLLDFRKFESGRMQLQSAEGDIVKFVREIFIAFEQYAKSKQISLDFQTDKNEILTFFDRDKMEKILYNLLSNAIKFTPTEGKVTISLSVQFSKESGQEEFVGITITDNGVGIEKENLDKIFERYQRFNEKDYSTQGAGIGLSFTKSLVELHKGTITVDSQRQTTDDRGYTSFEVRLPLGSYHLDQNDIITDFKDSENLDNYLVAGIEDSINEIVESTSDFSVEQGEKPVILVVEDNTDVRNFIVDAFQDNFIVHSATDGSSGLSKAHESIPDLIISDVMMPGMNGIDLCKNIKADYQTSHIPVVLLTARTPLIFNIEGLESGADDYITKPFNLKFLKTRVQNLLESRTKLRNKFRQEVILQPNKIAISSPDETFLEKAVKFIEDNIDKPTLTVEELGKEVGMSRNTLYRKIKALTNQTAVEFIRSFRMKRAGQLLQENKMNVNEVAYMVGIQDIDYFRKCFKEHFGSTPSDYAKKDHHQ